MAKTLESEASITGVKSGARFDGFVAFAGAAVAAVGCGGRCGGRCGGFGASGGVGHSGWGRAGR